MSRTVTLLGSTGSIGTQAVSVLTAHPDRFQVRGLAAGGSDLALLAEQTLRLGAEQVAIADDGAGPAFRDALAAASAAAGTTTPAVQVLTGAAGVTEVAGSGADVVLNGITGSVGLAATLAALAAGSVLALANKESLIVGGALVTSAAAPGQIVPVDSEHSAIAQCLRAGRTPRCAG